MGVTSIGNFRQGARIYVGTQDITPLVERYQVRLSVYGDSAASLNLVYDYNIVKMIENPLDKAHAFSYGNKVAIYIEHPFSPGKYLQVFYGEISGASISRSKYRSQTGISVTCTGFMHHLNKVVFPYGLGTAAKNVENILFAALTGNTPYSVSQNVMKMYATSDELSDFIRNILKGSVKKVSDLVNIAFVGANSFENVTALKSYSVVKDRFLYVMDAEFPSILQESLQQLLNNKLHLKNLGDFLKVALSYLMCEMFSDSNGSIVVKPSCWNFGIPKSHFLHPMLIESINTSESHQLKYTRSIIRSNLTSTGASGNGDVRSYILGIYKEDNTCTSFTVAGDYTIEQEGEDSQSILDAMRNVISSTPDVKTDSALDPTDYERVYGISAYAPNPFIHTLNDIAKRDAYIKDVVMPYAKYMLHSANKETSTASIQSGCVLPWLRIGFNCMPLPFDKVYYIAAIAHTGVPAKGGTTTISGNYGTSMAALKNANSSDIHHFATPNGYSSLTMPSYTDALMLSVPEEYKRW